MKSTVVRSLAALTVFGVSALSLSACTSGNSDAPADVMKSYINHLNAGEYEAALALVASPGDIEPENVLNIGGTSISEPLLGDEEEISEDAEAVSLLFKVGAEDEGDVDFVRVDEEWKLEEPLFLVALWPESSGSDDQAQAESIVKQSAELQQTMELTSPDEKAVTEDSYTVAMFGEIAEVPATFPGSEMFEPAEGTLTFEFDSSDQLGIVDPDDPEPGFGDPVFTDSFNKDAVKTAVDMAETTFNEDYGTYSISDIELSESRLSECGGSVETSRLWSSDALSLSCDVTSFTLSFDTAWNPEHFTNSESFDAGESVTMTPEMNRFNDWLSLGITFDGGKVSEAGLNAGPRNLG